MLLKDKIIEIKEDITENIYVKCTYFSEYLYTEDDCFPKVIVENRNSVSIKYDNGERDLIIQIDKDTSYDDLYLYVNQSKLFYRPCTDKLCLFTGAFNPPTIAHYHMIEAALSAYTFDYIIFAISSQNFLNNKQRKLNDWAFFECERLFMLTAMTCHLKNVLVFGAERGYTYDTLCSVKQQYNARQVFFALGSDKLNEIGRWGHHDKLLTEFCFYVLNREKNLTSVIEKSQKLFEKTQYIVHDSEDKYKEVSATRVRECMKKGIPFEDLVHPSLYPFLKDYYKNSIGSKEDEEDAV